MQFVWRAHHRPPSIPGGPSNPLLKRVAFVPGGWLENFWAHPALWLLPVGAFVGAGLAILLRRRPSPRSSRARWWPVCTIATAGVSLFPFLLPSSSQPDMSLTVWDASSSRLTLAVMLGAVCVFLPLVIAYTGWVYRVLRGPVSAETIAGDSHAHY